MLPKKKRLTTAEFSRFFASGRRIQGTYIQLIYTPHPTFHGAAVAGKKVYRSAVKRNKVRRRLYDALYRAHCRDALTGVYIVIAKPLAASADFDTLRTELDALLQKSVR